MAKEQTIVSWNIAGGHTINSMKHFDYNAEDLPYFEAALREVDPDVVLLQESHSNDFRSVAEDLADRLGYGHVYEQPMSPSHVDSEYQLGMATLSKRPLEQIQALTYPYPEFPLRFKNSAKPVEVHHKGAQLFVSDDIMIANTQMLPLALFSEEYDRGNGRELAKQIEASLLGRLSMPLIFGGDFNFDTPATVYPRMYGQLALKEALPDVTTRPHEQDIKKTPDHIIYAGLKLGKAAVQVTNTDHYLCIAQFARD